MAFFVCYGLFPFVMAFSRLSMALPVAEVSGLRSKRYDSYGIMRRLGAAEAGDLRYVAFRIA